MGEPCAFGGKTRLILAAERIRADERILILYATHAETQMMGGCGQMEFKIGGNRLTHCDDRFNRFPPPPLAAAEATENHVFVIPDGNSGDPFEPALLRDVVAVMSMKGVVDAPRAVAEQIRFFGIGMLAEPFEEIVHDGQDIVFREIKGVPFAIREQPDSAFEHAGVALLFALMVVRSQAGIFYEDFFSLDCGEFVFGSPVGDHDMGGSGLHFPAVYHPVDTIGGLVGEEEEGGHRMFGKSGSRGAAKPSDVRQ